MDRTPKQGEFYRHFKNKIYQIVAVATHSETKEKLVIYQALYDDFGIYARPLDMFVSEVDHEKYPDVTQKYRFEKVKPGDSQEKAKEDVAKKPAKDMTQNSVLYDEQTPDPHLMEFLDADTFEEKYNILVSMRDTITDRLIEDIAVVMDVVIPEGPMGKRYDDLKNIIKTRQYYEFSNRLR